MAIQLYYLTRARSEPTSDPVNPVIGKSVSGSVNGWICPGYFREFAPSNTIIWQKFCEQSARSSNAHKDTESDNCRLQVCSLSIAKEEGSSAFNPAAAAYTLPKKSSGILDCYMLTGNFANLMFSQPLLNSVTSKLWS